MKTLEAKIRDHIANDLDFIEDDLKLIEKEYKLENAFGTRGRIDILAEDKFNNFLIIEIKRSNQSARQAIHEVLKYAGLIQQKLRAKVSEIRICIISTEWDELLVPYSEFKRNSDYFVEGIKIHLDENMIPSYKEHIQELDKFQSRKISENHLAFLYRSESKMKESILLLKDELDKIGIDDFIFLELAYSRSTKIPVFPFSLYLVFQECSLEKLKFLISERFAHEDVADAEENISDEIYLRSYLEEVLLSKISCSLYDSVEIGYPDKFLSITKIQGWEIRRILKYGNFLDDPRSKNDEVILSEIDASKAVGASQYHNKGFSKFKQRLEEIKSDSLKCLESENIGNAWREHAEFIFSEIEGFGSDYDVSVSIYNPKHGILNSIFYMINYVKFGANTAFEFCPTWVIRADFTNDRKSSLVASGQIYWDGSRLSIKELLSLANLDDLHEYVYKSIFGDQFLSEYLVFKSLGFHHETDVFWLEDGETYSSMRIIEQEDEIAYTPLINTPTIVDFLNSSKTFLQELNHEISSFRI